jgi:hypothetical protein
MSMVGRNVLGMQEVGGCLLENISALCVFCIMFNSTVYLLISEICIFLMFLSTGYLFFMARCLQIYVVARILSYACDFHAS